MSASFTVLGPEARVRVNGVLCDTVEGNYRGMADKAEVTDSENIGGKRVKVGLTQFAGDFTCQVATDVTPHASGSLNINLGAYVHLEVFPTGLANGSYDVPLFCIEEWDGSYRVQGSAPQSFKFSGESDGDYTLPSGSLASDLWNARRSGSDG